MFLDLNLAPLIGIFQVFVMIILLSVLVIVTLIVLKKVNLNNDKERGKDTLKEKNEDNSLNDEFNKDKEEFK